MNIVKILLFIITSLATLQASWDPPVDLSVAGQNAGSPHVSIDSSGNAVAVWLRYNGTNFITQASTWDGIAWTAPVNLSAAGQDANKPQVSSSDSSGDAIAVWEWFNGTNLIIQASTWDGISWTAPVDLSAAGQNALLPQISVNSSGNAIAVWKRFDGSSFIIQASTWDGIAWATPVNLSTLGQFAEAPQVSVDDSGNAVAAWHVFNGTNNIVQASTWDGIAWTTPVNLSVAGQNASNVQVSIDNLGNAVAVWIRSNGTNNITQASTWNGIAWTTPVNLSAPGQNAINAQVDSADSSGNAIAVWERPNGTNRIIQASTWNGIAWTAPVDLSAVGQDAFVPQISVDSLGNAVAVWIRSDGTNTIVQASTWGGIAWTTPENISLAGQSATLPEVSVNDSGDAVAVWTRSNGTHNIIQAATGSSFFQPIPPSDFIGMIAKNTFLTQVDNLNKLSWFPSTDINVVGYRIYQNGQVVAEISSSGPFKKTFHNRKIGIPYTYSLVSFYVSNIESDPVTLTIK